MNITPRGKLPLSLVKADPGLQVRTCTDTDYCDELAALLKADPDFELPDVTAFEDETGTVWLADGFHRHEGYRLAGRERLPVRVKKGSRDDALAFAIAANETHGMRRSPADRRRAVQVALQHPVIGQKSKREIAKLCGGVSWELVNRVHEELQGLRPVADGSSRQKAKPTAGPADAGSGAGRSESVAAGPYACTDCPRSFIRQVWHCPGCGGHWLPEQEACESCEAARPMPADWYSKAATAAPVEKVRHRSSAGRDNQAPVETSAAAQTADALPLAGPPEPITEQVCDQLGRPVPDGLIEAFRTVKEFRSLVQAIGHLKSRVEALRANGRPGADCLRADEVDADLKNAQSGLRFAMPFVVCPSCQGKHAKGCLCEGRGWLREDQFGRLTAEMKAACEAFRKAG